MWRERCGQSHSCPHLVPKLSGQVWSRVTFGARSSVSDIPRVEEVVRAHRANEISHVIPGVLSWDYPSEEQILKLWPLTPVYRAF